MKAKSKCMGKHNANNRLSMRPIWQMSLAGIWKHFTSNRLFDRVIRSHFFFSAVFRLWELTFGTTTALRSGQPGALTKTIMEPKLLTWKNMTLLGCASVYSCGDCGVCTARIDRPVKHSHREENCFLILTLAYLSMQYAVKCHINYTCIYTYVYVTYIWFWFFRFALMATVRCSTHLRSQMQRWKWPSIAAWQLESVRTGISAVS